MTKRILLGITGGIAAYKSAELVRLFAKAGWSTQVVMTPVATRFVGPMTLEALSGESVLTNPFEPLPDGTIAHIELPRRADAIVIAPATADTLARLAAGRADDLISAICLARTCPLLVAPAMNVQMWNHPATQRNIAQLEADGVVIVGPGSGDLACGETGRGRLIDVSLLFEAIEAELTQKRLNGKRVVVTAGPTVEPIDPVRMITNASSGKMGYAIARAAHAAGAKVTLISGPTALDCPYGVERISVTSTAQMHDAVLANIEGADVFFSVAAVSDYRVETVQKTKIKHDENRSLTLVLQPNVDILAEVAARPNPPFCVGFAAETDNWIENAQIKRRKKGIPIIFLNDASVAIGADNNRLTLLDDSGSIELPYASKRELATMVIDKVADYL